MKLTAIFLIVSCLSVCGKSVGQDISLRVQQAPLEKVLSEIEKQSGMAFIYVSGALEPARPITMDVRNMPLQRVLALVFKDQPLSYTVKERYIVLQSKTTEEDIPPLIDVHGRVVNEKGEPVAGATVTVKGTRNATATDDNGEFTLKDVDENATLVISGVNIESFEVRVNGRTDLATLDAKIKIGSQAEVQIVGTGYQDVLKERSTGAYEKVDNKILNQQTSPNILDRLKDVSSGISFDTRQLSAQKRLNSPPLKSHFSLGRSNCL